MTSFRSIARLRFAAVVVGLSILTACGSPSGSNGSADPTTATNGTTVQSAATCSDGSIHARVCTGTDPNGLTGTDVANDPNQPCPAGYTVDAAAAATYCCDPVSATAITSCTAPIPADACGPLGPGEACSTSVTYVFTPTNCNDSAWSSAHPELCSDEGVDAWSDSH